MTLQRDGTAAFGDDATRATWTPSQARARFANGLDTGPTAGVANGYVQANLVIVPERNAFDFLLFCQRNPKPCPLLEVIDRGQFEAQQMAPGSDIRRDLPLYRIYRRGELEGEMPDLLSAWREDFVSFLLGCSFTFEAALLSAGVEVRHLEEGKNVPMYVTSLKCHQAKSMNGHMVVSMRPIPYQQVVRAVQVTSRFPSAHGAPVHIGDPSVIGIEHLSLPDFGDAVEIRNGEVPVFWACGVTPQRVALESQLPIMITHAPGHMFVTDLRDSQIATQ